MSRHVCLATFLDERGEHKWWAECRRAKGHRGEHWAPVYQVTVKMTPDGIVSTFRVINPLHTAARH